MLGSRTLALLVLCLSWLLTAGAGAQSVVLDLSGCAAPAESEVRALSALELRGRLRDAEAAAQAHDERITVLCTGDRASLLSAPRGDLRTIDLASVPLPLRARLLALAIAELARAQVAEAAEGGLSSAPSPVETKATLAPVLTAPPTSSRRPSTASVNRPSTSAWSGLSSVGVELSPTPLLAAAGLLSTLVRVATPLAWTATISLGQARRDIDLGRLRVRALGLRTGPALLRERAHSMLYAGLAARLSLLELRGEPAAVAQAQSTRFRTFLLAPAAFAGAGWLFGRLLVALDLELCHQLREVRADVRTGMSRSRATTLSPFRVALGLSAGVRW